MAEFRLGRKIEPDPTTGMTRDLRDRQAVFDAQADVEAAIGACYYDHFRSAHEGETIFNRLRNLPCTRND